MITVNNKPINVTIFPDKTSQVWKLDEELLALDEVRIDWTFESEAEVIHLLQLKDLLDQYNVKANLSISYLPYGRQDKKVNNNRTFALNTFAKLINNANFNNVELCDPHPNTRDYIHQDTELAKFLLKSSRKHVSIYDVVGDAAFEDSIIVAPDEGARRRYGILHTLLKKRDQLTGEILGMEIPTSLKPNGETIWLMDDICDGGKTFTEAAKLLYNNGAKEVNLYVTHGIFSKGLTPLKEAGINKIYTKDGEACVDENNKIYYRRL